jgi:hypothetical protein
MTAMDDVRGCSGMYNVRGGPVEARVCLSAGLPAKFRTSHAMHAPPSGA